MLSTVGCARLTRQHLIAVLFFPLLFSKAVFSVCPAEAGVLRFTKDQPILCHRVCGLRLRGGKDRKVADPLHISLAILAAAASAWVKLNTSTQLHQEVMVFLDVGHVDLVLTSCAVMSAYPVVTNSQLAANEK